MVRVWAFVLSWVVALPVVLYGAGFLIAAAVEAFMVALRGAQPGDQVILSDTSAWDAHDRIRLN